MLQWFKRWMPDQNMGYKLHCSGVQVQTVVKAQLQHY